MRLEIGDKFFQIFGLGHLGIDLRHGKQSTEHQGEGCAQNGI
jgi:hypothetical protein